MLWASDRVVFPGEAPATYTLEAGWVRIEGTQIAEVGRGPAPEGATHFGDKLLAPAFVDTHTHLSLVALRGFDPSARQDNVVEDLFYRFETLLRPEDVASFARVGAYETLLHGVGMVWDHYFHGLALAEAIADTGLSAVVAPTIQDLAGPGVPHVDAAFEETERLLRSRWQERGIYAALGPHATDTVSEARWHECVAMARQHGLPMHAHLAQSPQEVRRCRVRHECTPLEWLQKLGVLDEVPAVFAHALFVSQPDLSLLKDHHNLVICPYAQMDFAFPARTDVWDQAGVHWSVATDAAASNDSTNLMKELRFVAGRGAVGTSWSPAYEAFLAGQGDAKAVWAERAERHTLTDAANLLHRVWDHAGALHPGFRAGVIATGALANLVVWDTDAPSFWPGDDPLRALVYGDVSGAIHAMAVAGRTVGEVGAFGPSLRASSGYREACADAKSRLQKLLQRLR